MLPCGNDVTCQRFVASPWPRFTRRKCRPRREHSSIQRAASCRSFQNYPWVGAPRAPVPLPPTSPTMAAAAIACASRRSPLASLRQGERPTAGSDEGRTGSSFPTKLANSPSPRLGQSLMRFISEQLVGANESEPIATYPTSTLDHSLTESSTRTPDGPLLDVLVRAILLGAS